jgi:hypothetical protein
VFKSEKKLDLSNKEIIDFDINSKLKKFIWNFGVGLFTNVFRFDFVDLNKLLNLGTISFGDEFTPKYKDEEVTIEKVTVDRKLHDASVKVQNTLLFKLKIIF